MNTFRVPADTGCDECHGDLPAGTVAVRDGGRTLCEDCADGLAS